MSNRYERLEHRRREGRELYRQQASIRERMLAGARRPVARPKVWTREDVLAAAGIDPGDDGQAR